MMHSSKRAAVATFALSLIAGPLAMASDEPVGVTDDASAAPVLQAASDPAANAGDQATPVASATDLTDKQDPDSMTCRKEKPTGSHRMILVCRPTVDSDSGNAEVEREMNRMKHYGNPTVTPRG